MNTAHYSFSHARRLNEICDCPCGCRELQSQEFLNINFKNIPAHLRLEYLYIIGKFYFHRAKSDNRLENLENSNTFFDQIFIVSQQAGLEVSNPKKWFKAAHTKYELSKVMTHQEDTLMLTQRALQITEEALTKFPENKSIRWLIEELNSI